SNDAWTRAPREGAGVTELARAFEAHAAPWRRVWRTVLLVALNVALFYLLWNTLPHAALQARGQVTRFCYWVALWVTLFSSAALLMFVVDSTLLSYRFVTALVGHRRRTWTAAQLAEEGQRWPEEQRDAAAREWNLGRTSETDAAVSQWLS